MSASSSAALAVRLGRNALHLQRSGGTPADVSAVAPERLHYVQLCDGPFQPILPDSTVALTEARTGQMRGSETRPTDWHLGRRRP